MTPQPQSLDLDTRLADKPRLSTSEAAWLTGLTESTLRYHRTHATTGFPQSFKTGGRYYYETASVIDHLRQSIDAQADRIRRLLKTPDHDHDKYFRLYGSPGITDRERDHLRQDQALFPYTAQAGTAGEGTTGSHDPRGYIRQP